MPHGVPVAGEVRGVRAVGGEPASEVDLPVVATEHLVVGGEHLHLATRHQVDLDAGAAQLVAHDHLLDDSPTGGEVAEEPVGQGGDAGQYLVRVPSGARLVAQVEHEVAVAGAAVVVLDHHRGHVGA